jgi:hypothetical protein
MAGESRVVVFVWRLVAGRSGGWGGRSPVATNCFGLTLSAQPQRVRPMSAFIQVISRGADRSGADHQLHIHIRSSVHE